MYKKNKLKNDININKEKTIIFVWVFNIVSKLLIGKKPPDAINVIDKFNEINDLKSNKLSNKKIIIVKKE